jgi:hypothetical protein
MMTSKFEIITDESGDVGLYCNGVGFAFAWSFDDESKSRIEAVIDMQDKIARLEALNAELLAALKEMITSNRWATCFGSAKGTRYDCRYCLNRAAAKTPQEIVHKEGCFVMRATSIIAKAEAD